MEESELWYEELAIKCLIRVLLLLNGFLFWLSVPLLFEQQGKNKKPFSKTGRTAHSDTNMSAKRRHGTTPDRQTDTKYYCTNPQYYYTNSKYYYTNPQYYYTNPQYYYTNPQYYYTNPQYYYTNPQYYYTNPQYYYTNPPSSGQQQINDTSRYKIPRKTIPNECTTP
ncbi:hypothetical protein QZH41_016589 [Actinostola sp. cb2023]|nr:hypothetical protein QZH41_016589 [Actinostola sp. cb2023]